MKSIQNNLGLTEKMQQATMGHMLPQTTLKKENDLDCIGSSLFFKNNIRKIS